MKLRRARRLASFGVFAHVWQYKSAMFRTVERTPAGVRLTRPAQAPVERPCTSPAQRRRRRRRRSGPMVVRGAPAIGVTAAFGAARSPRRPASQARSGGVRSRDRRGARGRWPAARPTAVNLFWALTRMEGAASAPRGRRASRKRRAGRRRSSARRRRSTTRICAACRAIGRHGAALVPERATVLTHCNAGGLATAGFGTALGVDPRRRSTAGKKVRVLADETRPLLQGARLTAWELMEDGIETVLIADSSAGSLMRRGEVDLVVVGADRIAANGDVANKIGTYSVAVLAKENGVPFYVAAPLSTIDLACPDGDRIPIEERDPTEVTELFGSARSPRTASACCNPAFDVTPARYVDARSSPSAGSRGLPTPTALRCAQRSGRKRHGQDPRHRELVRRDGRRGRRGSLPRALVGHRLAGRHPREVRRRRAGARLAPPPRVHRAGRDRGARACAAPAFSGLDAIAVTCGPGLVGPCSWAFARRRRWRGSSAIPLIAVNHLEGHVRSPFLEHPGIELPAIALVVSGGHTALYLCPEEGLPAARADAGRRRGRGVRQGREVPRASLPRRTGHRPHRRRRERARDRLPARGHEEPVARFLVQRLEDRGAHPRDARRPGARHRRRTPKRRRRSAISWRRSSARSSRRCVDTTLRACRREGVTTVLLAGGVACNRRLRRAFDEAAARATDSRCSCRRPGTRPTTPR